MTLDKIQTKIIQSEIDDIMNIIGMVNKTNPVLDRTECVVIAMGIYKKIYGMN